MTSSNGGRLKGLPAGDSMHVVERFTRVSRDEIMWEATIEDPDVYDRPWTISMPLTRADLETHNTLLCRLTVEQP